MTDEEEFLPASSSNGRGKAMLGYCYIADAECARRNRRPHPHGESRRPLPFKLPLRLQPEWTG